mgnify:CR=1 FL=1
MDKRILSVLFTCLFYVYYILWNDKFIQYDC